MTTNRLRPNRPQLWFRALMWLLASGLFLTSCARLRDYTDQEFEDRQKLLRLYESVGGTYNGELQILGERSLNVELMIYIVEVREGVDPDGNVRFRPSLKARYRNQNVVGESDDEVLDVRYYPENGELLMTSSNLNSATAFLSARGTLILEQLNASITKNGGYYGSLRATRISNQATSPSDGFEAERRARLRQIYSVITGTYKGGVQQPNTSAPYPIEIALYIIEVPDGTTAAGEPRFKPQLEARFRSPEDPLNPWDNAKLDVRYYFEKGEIVLNSRDIQNGGFVIRTFYENEKLHNGEITKAGGLFGNFTAQRTSRDVVAPNDDEITRQRLRHLYQKLEGTYSGELKAQNGEIRKVEIKIFIIDEVSNNGAVTPTLKGRYRRLDFDPGIGEYYMSLRYFVQTGALVMSSASPSTSPIPGAGTLSINGKWDKDRIYDAEVFDHRGFLGSLTARKK